MFYDLNVPYTTNHTELQRTLSFLAELGYNTIALTHTISGKIPSDLTSPIPNPLPFSTPPGLKILTRCTLHTDTPTQRLSPLSQNYNLFSILPHPTEKGLQTACLSLFPLDILSLDLSIRYPFYFKQKQFLAAVERGVRIEICYAQGILGDRDQRRNFLQNVVGVVRATRGGRGVVVSSGGKGGAVGARAPWDVVNLCVGWGMGAERGVEGVGRVCRGVVASAEMRRRSFMGVIEVVSGLEEKRAESKMDSVEEKGKGKAKRKVEALEEKEGDVKEAEKPSSKREMKRRAKKAMMEKIHGTADSRPSQEATKAQQISTSNKMDEMDRG